MVKLYGSDDESKQSKRDEGKMRYHNHMAIVYQDIAETTEFQIKKLERLK